MTSIKTIQELQEQLAKAREGAVAEMQKECQAMNTTLTQLGIRGRFIFEGDWSQRGRSKKAGHQAKCLTCGGLGHYRRTCPTTAQGRNAAVNGVVAA